MRIKTAASVAIIRIINFVYDLRCSFFTGSQLKTNSPVEGVLFEDLKLTYKGRNFRFGPETRHAYNRQILKQSLNILLSCASVTNETSSEACCCQRPTNLRQ